ncbi:MAG: hypothetical protein U5K43_13100 [Halofilum sp. (in: g-proteobacteria)]|nr:hypothetical protein [Halofilum sp. (in: g-proteobacteria)]
MLDPVLKRIDNGLEESIGRWSELLRIPSVSTDPGVRRRHPPRRAVAPRGAGAARVHGRDPRDRRPPRGPRPPPGAGRRRAAGALLRPLRRAAAGPARGLGRGAVRAHAGRRPAR